MKAYLIRGGKTHPLSGRLGSGRRLFPTLWSIRPDIAVIVSSGHTEGHALSGFAGTSVSGFIQKPYTSHALASIVKRVLAWAERRRT